MVVFLKNRDNADSNSRENEQQPPVLKSDFLLVSRHNYRTRRLCHSILSFPAETKCMKLS